MAGGFDVTIMVSEVDEGRFRMFFPFGTPAGTVMRQPRGIAMIHQISGPLDLFPRLNMPQGELSLDEVRAWFDQVRALGCSVREGNNPF